MQPGQQATWVHARHAVQPTPGQPDDALVATTGPGRRKSELVRVLDLTP
ncbi:hypothetical protein ACFYNX_31385 [Streptomyces sp. NPDC007872]